MDGRPDDAVVARLDLKLEHDEVAGTFLVGMSLRTAAPARYSKPHPGRGSGQSHLASPCLAGSRSGISWQLSVFRHLPSFRTLLPESTFSGMKPKAL